MQSVDLAVHDEPATETPEQTEVPRVRAPLPPQFEECCYPFGEPRTHGFRYCYTPVVQRGGALLPGAYASLPCGAGHRRMSGVSRRG